jgi:hypothetical protein
MRLNLKRWLGNSDRRKTTSKLRVLNEQIKYQFILLRYILRTKTADRSDRLTEDYLGQSLPLTESEINGKFIISL